jgi:hypothetical protein
MKLLRLDAARLDSRCDPSRLFVRSRAASPMQSPLQQRGQLSQHEFHLYSKHILDISGVVQVSNELLGGGNILLRASFYFLAKFCSPPEGADATVFFR